jgi:hypothetical protein
MFSWPPRRRCPRRRGDRLRSEHHRLEARAAHHVDRHRWHGVGNAGLDERLARGILAARGRQHLAQDHLGHLIGSDAVLREQRLDDGGAELGRRDLGERAAELADGVRSAPAMTISVMVISWIGLGCGREQRRPW